MFITHINTQDYWGGAAKIAWKLAEKQRLYGHYAYILCGQKKTNSPFSQTFDKKRDLFISKETEQKGLQYYDLYGSNELCTHSTIQNSDILHLHNLHGDYFNPFSLVSIAEKKPIVWTLHDMHSFTGHCAHSFECNKWETGCGNCPDLSIYPALQTDSTRLLLQDKKSIYQQCELEIVVPSMWLKKKVEKSILGDKKIHLVYNGIDEKIFYPRDRNKMREKYSIPKDAIVLAMSATGGINNPWKGHQYLIDLVKHISQKYPNLHFLNIGSLKTTLNLPNIIDIEYTQDENKIAELYCAADIYVYPSLADNCPLTVLEVMGCGIPIVAFNTGGIPELVIDEKSGILVEYKKFDQFLTMTERLINDKKLCDQYGLIARERFLKNFTIDKMFTAYDEIYKNIALKQQHAKLNSDLTSNIMTNTKNLQAKELAEAGKITEAIALFEEITIAEPLHFKANFNLGVLYSQQNELKKAARCYLKCLEAKANDRNTVINLTYILKNLDKAAEAEKILAAYLLENYDDQEMKNLLVALSEGKVVAKKPDLVKQEFKSTLVYIDPGYQDSFGHYMQMGRNIRESAETQAIEVLHFVNKNVSEDIVKNEKLVPIFQDIAYITNKTADYNRVLSDFEAKLIEIRNLLSNRDDKQVVIYMYTAHPLHFPIFARVFGECKTNNLEIVLNLFYLDSEFCNGNLDNYYDYLLRKCYEEFLACNRNNKVKIVFESKHASSRYLFYFGEREIFDAQPVAKINPLSYKHGSSLDKTMIAYIGHTNDKSGYHLVYQVYKMLFQTSWQNKIHFKIKHSKKFFNAEFLKMYEEFTMQSRSIEHFNGFLSAEDYHNFYNDCDIVLLPYSKKHYPVQTSGVLVDAVLAKKIIIAPKDTWLGDIVEKNHFGVTFQSDNLADFTNAIIEVVGKIDQYKALFETNYQEFAQQHSANYLLMQLGFDLQSDQSVKAKSTDFCPACGESRVNYLKDLFGQRTKNQIKLYQCGSCLTLFNPSGYHEDDKALELDALWHIDKIDRNKLMGQDLLTELLMHHPMAKSFLDIGAGVGSLILSAQKLGLSVEGVELNKFAVDYAQKNLGLQLRNSYYQAGVYDKKFDIITIVMVLEHLEQPAKLLAEAIKDLNRDGLLFVSVPFYYPEQHKKYIENPNLNGTLFFDNDVHITHFTDQGFIQMCKQLGATSLKKIDKGWSGYILKFD